MSREKLAAMVIADALSAKVVPSTGGIEVTACRPVATGKRACTMGMTV
jgi:hypothetical protein